MKITKWAPSPGESIEGKFLFFRPDKDSLVAVLKTEDLYYILPNEVTEMLQWAEKMEGKDICVEFSQEGYFVQIKEDISK